MPRDPKIADVLTFWIDEIGVDGWYKRSDQTDMVCRDRFGLLWADLAAGRHRDWLLSAPGALAYLVIADQIPRNIHRGGAAAFSTDRLARSATVLAIARGFDEATPEPQRQFFYLPLMHSEVLSDQERSVRMIMTRMPETGHNNLEHAIKHRDVIRRFGRFPSRNAALGRTDSDTEIAYRAAKGYMS